MPVFKHMLDRRKFLKVMSSAAAVVKIAPAAWAERSAEVVIVVDPADKVAISRPAQWVTGYLADALRSRGIAVNRLTRLDDEKPADFTIVAASTENATARRILQNA